MSCFRCGKCCFPYSIGMSYDEHSHRWLTYHGLIVQQTSEDRMVLHGHSRCEMLQVEPGGLTSCAVYNDRPQICAEYLCARALQESE